MPKIVLMYLSSTASKACKATQCTAACQADVSVQAVCDEHVDNSMQIDHPVKIDVPTQTEDLSCTAGKASKATQCTAVCQADVSVQTVHDEHVDPVIEDVPTQTDCHLDLSTKVQCNQHHASEPGHENVQSVAQAIHICEAPVFVQTSDVNGQMSSPSEPEDIHAHGQASLPADEVDLFLMPEDIHANQDSQSDDKDEWFPLSSIVPNIFTPNLKKRKVCFSCKYQSCYRVIRGFSDKYLRVCYFICLFVLVAETLQTVSKEGFVKFGRLPLKKRLQNL